MKKVEVQELANALAKKGHKIQECIDHKNRAAYCVKNEFGRMAFVINRDDTSIDELIYSESLWVSSTARGNADVQNKIDNKLVNLKELGHSTETMNIDRLWEGVRSQYQDIIDENNENIAIVESVIKSLQEIQIEHNTK